MANLTPSIDQVIAYVKEMHLLVSGEALKIHPCRFLTSNFAALEDDLRRYYDELKILEGRVAAAVEAAKEEAVKPLNDTIIIVD